MLFWCIFLDRVAYPITGCGDLDGAVLLRYDDAE
jgi:hypothetical protein